MKKIFAISLALLSILGLFSFAGCSNKDNYDLWVAGLDGGYGTVGWNSAINEFERVYEQNHGKKIKVKRTFSATVEKEISSPLNVDAGPDFVYLATQRQAGLTESMYSGSTNRLFSLNGLLEKNVYNEDVKLKDKILPRGIGNNITNPIPAEPNNHYLLPVAMGSSGLYYNASMFNGDMAFPASATELLTIINNGAKYPIPQTMDQFLLLGKQLNIARSDSVGKDGADVPYLFTYPTPGYFDTMIPSMIASNAGQDSLTAIYNYESGSFTNASVTKVYSDIASLADYAEPSTLRNGNDTNFRENQQLVMLNKALFQPNGNWVIGEMGEFAAASGFEWASMAFPGYTKDGAVERYGKLHMEQVWLPKNGASEVKPIVEEFVLFLYSKVGQAELSKGKGMLVPTVDYLEAGVSLPSAIKGGAKDYYSPDFKEAVGTFGAFEPFTASSGLGGGQMDAKRFKLDGWCGGMEQILKAKANEPAFYKTGSEWAQYNQKISDEIKASRA